MSVKESLPWFLKIAAKMILSRLPVRFDFWQKAGLFRHGKMDQTDYVISNFHKLIGVGVGGFSELEGKVLVELGPGDSIGTSIVAASYGMKSILIDVGRFATNDTSFYCSLSKDLAQRGLKPPEINAGDCLDSILKKCNAQYLTDGLDSIKSLEENTVDIIISQAVLEHIAKSEFAHFAEEMFRIVKDRASAVHEIDLKDHLAKALNNLRFSERVWESNFFRNSGFYTNRLRYSEICEIFSLSGFNLEVDSINRWNEMPTPIRRLNESFQSLDESDLLISDFVIRLKKLT